MLIIFGVICVYIINMTNGNPVSRESKSENEVTKYDFPFVSRVEWNARPPKAVIPQKTPVTYVVIHHSYKPAACYNDSDCCQAMRVMQNFHIDERDWCDIGYNFAIGSNGKAYEGRGWKTLGAQALHFNSVSVGICLIGDWNSTVPPAEQLKTAQKLIEAGVNLGFIKPDYKLVGHRQVRETECPGDALFNEILIWPNYSSFPKSVDDLQYVEELSTAIKKQVRKERQEAKEKNYSLLVVQVPKEGNVTSNR